jgi:hypothetical protein
MKVRGSLAHRETTMKKFLVLYRSTISVKEQRKRATPDQMKASMGAWKGWVEKYGSAVVDMGAPLGDSALLKGTAGPGHIDGYSFVQAESLDSARSMFGAHPHFGAPGAPEAPGASIEILEVVSMPAK